MAFTRQVMATIRYVDITSDCSSTFVDNGFIPFGFTSEGLYFLRTEKR